MSWCLEIVRIFSYPVCDTIEQRTDARHFKPGQDRDTASYASAGYAPPEQYGQAQTTPRSDIYSLGVVLHQMLSGHNPSTTPFRLPSLLSQSPPIPRQLATLIAQMLEPDPNKRPADVLAVRQIRQDLVSALTLVPPPPALAARRPPPPPPVYIPPMKASRSPQVLQPGYQFHLSAGNPTFSPPGLPAHPPRKKAGWIILSVCIVGIIIVGGGWIFSIVLAHGSLAYPHLASSYQGIVQNTTAGESSLFTLTIVQDQQAISGREQVGPGLLAGSGPFTGTVGTDNSIHFTVNADDGSNAVTTFTGSITSQNTLSGTYTTHFSYPGLGNQTQTGTWEASASTT